MVGSPVVKVTDNIELFTRNSCVIIFYLIFFRNRVECYCNFISSGFAFGCFRRCKRIILSFIFIIAVSFLVMVGGNSTRRICQFNNLKCVCLSGFYKILCTVCNISENTCVCVIRHLICCCEISCRINCAVNCLCTPIITPADNSVVARIFDRTVRIFFVYIFNSVSISIENNYQSIAFNLNFINCVAVRVTCATRFNPAAVSPSPAVAVALNRIIYAAAVFFAFNYLEFVFACLAVLNSSLKCSCACLLKLELIVIKILIVVLAVICKTPVIELVIADKTIFKRTAVAACKIPELKLAV